MTPKANFVDTPIADIEEELRQLETYVRYNLVHDRAPIATESAYQTMVDLEGDLLAERQRLEDADQE